MGRAIRRLGISSCLGHGFERRSVAPVPFRRTARIRCGIHLRIVSQNFGCDGPSKVRCSANGASKRMPSAVPTRTSFIRRCTWWLPLRSAVSRALRLSLGERFPGSRSAISKPHAHRLGRPGRHDCPRADASSSMSTSESVPKDRAKPHLDLLRAEPCAGTDDVARPSVRHRV